MHIQRAKDEIKRAVQAYLAKDAYGDYKIPVLRQRPILLMGPPGIGKTAIVAQAAQECGIALVSYTITHHTRQSAIGLPFIRQKIYQGQEYSVTEYTMSEIIASVYERMEATGLSEGILFIDEINCVSETLAPAMLQFLQGKTFGNHKVPLGWIIVAAGNPPEYNKSVREFDIVTLDRLKRLEVSEDYTVWREYAYQQSIHGSILSYLEIKRDSFYAMETTVDGKKFVTPRGWEDLSQLIAVYEELSLPIDEALVLQYLQHRKIAKDFAHYFDLYGKYKTDYKVEEILAGHISEAAVERLQDAPFDEKLSVIGLLLSALGSSFQEVYATELYITELFGTLKKIKMFLQDEPAIDTLLSEQIEKLQNEDAPGQRTLLKDKEAARARHRTQDTLFAFQKTLQEERITASEAGFERLRELFGAETEKREDQITKTSSQLSHGFDFMETVFGEGQEMVIFITELTANFYSMKFISEQGSDRYYRYNKELLFHEKQRDILQDIAEAEGLLDLL